MNVHHSLWMYWLDAIEHQENVIYIVLHLKMLILNNCSTFLGFGAWTVHMLHSNRTFSLWKTDHGPAWECPVRWEQVKRHSKDRGTHSFLQETARPRSQGRGLSLTTAQAASWGGKAGSPWCTRKPRCRSSSSRQSLCTSAAPAVPGPETTHGVDTPELLPLLRSHHSKGQPALLIMPHTLPAPTMGHWHIHSRLRRWPHLGGGI